MDVKRGSAVKFREEVADLLRRAIELKGRGRRKGLREKDYWEGCLRLEGELEKLVCGQYRDADNEQ